MDLKLWWCTELLDILVKTIKSSRLFSVEKILIPKQLLPYSQDILQLHSHETLP